MLPETDIQLLKLPPQEIEAEQMVLGACLVDPEHTVSTALVRTDDFYKILHRGIFSAFQQIVLRGEDLDLITASAELKKPDYQKSIGETAISTYLAQLVSLVPTSSNFKSHQRLVIQAAQRRAVIKSCNEAIQTAYDNKDVDVNIGDCITKLNDIRRHEENAIVSHREIMMHGFSSVERRYEIHREKPGSVSGLTTGFRDLDTLLDGLHAQYYVIAGRPSMGKTAFAECIIANTAAAGNKVGFISIEMGEYQIAMRSLARGSGVSLSKILRGRIHNRDWNDLANTAGQQINLPIWYAFSSFSERQIERVIDDMVQRLGVQLIVVDYLQLMVNEDRYGSREQEVAKQSALFKRKVKEHKIPHLILSQLSRKLEDRPDKRPVLADLRESGSIEQDADVVMFVYRDEVYHCKCPKDCECSCGRRGKAEILIRKGRMEGTGTVDLVWSGRTTTFRDVEENAAQ